MKFDFPSEKEILVFLVIVACVGWMSIELLIWVIGWLFSHLAWI